MISIGFYIVSKNWYTDFRLIDIMFQLLDCETEEL